MVHFPARKVRATDVPLFALSVRRENERPLACPDQQPYRAHCLLLSEMSVEGIFTTSASVLLVRRTREGLQVPIMMANPVHRKIRMFVSPFGDEIQPVVGTVQNINAPAIG